VCQRDELVDFIGGTRSIRLGRDTPPCSLSDLVVLPHEPQARDRRRLRRPLFDGCAPISALARVSRPRNRSERYVAPSKADLAIGIRHYSMVAPKSIECV
jgi:hypothetical protein